MSETTTEAPAEATEKTIEDKVGALHQAHADFIKANLGVDVTPEQVFAIYSTRVKFRQSEAYRVGVRQAKEQEREAKEQAKVEAKQAKEAERAKKAEEAAAAKQAKEEERAKKAEEREAAKKAKEEAAAAKAAAKATDEGDDEAAAGAKPSSKKRGGKGKPVDEAAAADAPF